MSAAVGVAPPRVWCALTPTSACSLRWTPGKRLATCQNAVAGACGCKDFVAAHCSLQSLSFTQVSLYTQRRHGEVSRAMRNRGIEIFLLPQKGEEQQQQQLEQQEAALPELQQVLALAGLPGSTVPAAMAAAHAAVAEHAARRHRCVGAIVTCLHSLLPVVCFMPAVPAQLCKPVWQLLPPPLLSICAQASSGPA